MFSSDLFWSVEAILLDALPENHQLLMWMLAGIELVSPGDLSS